MAAERPSPGDAAPNQIEPALMAVDSNRVTQLRDSSGPLAFVRSRRSLVRQRHLLLLALLATAVFYVWPRVLDLDRAVTTDEPVFLAISANFANAVTHGDFAETSQFLYPAVPVMWAGAIGLAVEIPNYTDAAPGQVDDLYRIHEPIRAVGGDPLQALIAARTAKVVLQACVFLLAVWLMYRLFGLAVTALATTFISFDPFLVAHDQLLHVDGVTGITAFASMLAATEADRHRTGTALWALAGVLAALCWLTRLTGLVLLPIMLLVIADGALARYRWGIQPWSTAAVTAAKAAATIIGASVVTTIVAWPALWVGPVGAIQETLDGWRDAIETPHPWGLYFAGETVAGDPGLLFYVAVFLYKITPFTLVGLAIMAFAFLFRIGSIMPGGSWRPVVILASFVLVYSIGMAAGTRKFDRYILPDFLFFDLFAAIGIVGIARLVWTARQTAWKAVTTVAIVALVAGQIVSVQAQRPYLLDYHNPLLGGTETAEEMLMLGWGEGLDQVARFILAQPGGETAVVRTAFPGTSLSYFLPESVTTHLLAMDADQRGIRAWVSTDYAVTYILQWQRSRPGTVMHYLSSFEPVQTVEIGDVPFARVYDLSRIPPPDWMIEQSGCAWQFAGTITLAAYGPHQAADGATVRSGEQMIELIFQTDTGAGVPAQYRVRGILQPKGAGGAPISFTTSFVPKPEAGLLSTAVAAIRLPEGRTLSDYWLQVRVLDPVTGRPLPAVHLGSAASSTSAELVEC